MVRDQEGGYWITTYSDGVYYCPNLFFHTVSGPPALSFSSVHSLHSADRRSLVAGFDNGNIMILDRNTLQYRLFPRWAARNGNNRIMDVVPYTHHTLLVAADMGLHLLSLRDTDTLLQFGAYKELFVKADNQILAGTSDGILFLDSSAHFQSGPLPPRATCLAGLGDNFYWGRCHQVSTHGRTAISTNLDGSTFPSQESSIISISRPTPPSGSPRKKE